MRPVAETQTIWRVGKSWYRARHHAYYECAKRIVLAKYPPWLHDGDAEDIARSEGWPEGLWATRQEKREALFWTPDRYDEPAHFDVDKWQRFVRRFASYLAFVDRRPPSERDGKGEGHGDR